jgi:hypothetical protein
MNTARYGTCNNDAGSARLGFADRTHVDRE